MRPPLLALTVALVFVAAADTRAQPPVKFSRESNVFAFEPAPNDLTQVTAAEFKDKLKAKTELNVRPNAPTELNVWVLNPTANEEEFTVAVTGPDDATVAKGRATIPGATWRRVALKGEPAPPTPPAAPPQTPADPKQPAAAPAEPPPPGVEVPAARGEFRLTFRLLDKDGKEVTNKNDKLPYGGVYPVTVLTPSDYVEKPLVKLTPGKGTFAVSITVKPKTEFKSTGTTAVQLTLPPQDALAGAAVRSGIYRRTLTFDPNAPAVALGGTIVGAKGTPRVYVGVDGIERAFAYDLNPLGETPETQVFPDTNPAVRVGLVGNPARTLVTQPVAALPVRIEVDNPAATDALEIRLQPVGGPTDQAEIVKLDGTREVRVWAASGGPVNGGLLFNTRSRDWVKALDLANVRGKVEIKAVLTRDQKEIESKPIAVTVVAAPPEKVKFLKLADKLEKGKPLTVEASVNDPDSEITKATFYLFKQFEDGKIPAAAVKAQGEPSAKSPSVWTADLKLPDDFRGAGLVAVVFANAVGLTSEPTVQKIEIVDPKAKGPATGTVVGKVVFGERPQPGVPVSLRDADNKEKAAGVTDDDGKFKFENVAPGNYTLVAVKKDSSTGASGLASVRVLADPEKPEKSDKTDKDAKPAKPVPVVVTLVKNRM